MIDPKILAAVLSQVFQPAARHPAPKPLPSEFLVKHGAREPVTGKELHVMYQMIVPTEAYANVRLIASQTVAYNQGEGLTLEDRKQVLSRESRGLRELILEDAERLRRDLSDKAYVAPVSRRTQTTKKPSEAR